MAPASSRWPRGRGSEASKTRFSEGRWTNRGRWTPAPRHRHPRRRRLHGPAPASACPDAGPSCPGAGLFWPGAGHRGALGAGACLPRSGTHPPRCRHREGPAPGQPMPGAGAGLPRTGTPHARRRHGHGPAPSRVAPASGIVLPRRRGRLTPAPALGMPGAGTYLPRRRGKVTPAPGAVTLALDHQMVPVSGSLGSAGPLDGLAGRRPPRGEIQAPCREQAAWTGRRG